MISNNGIVELHGSRVELDNVKSILDLFKSQAKKHPDKVVLIEKDKKITIGKLYQLSTIGAFLLREKYNVSHRDKVAFLVGRSIDSLILIYSVLLAGGIYVPISKEYPNAKVDNLLKILKPKITFSEVESEGRVRIQQIIDEINSFSLDNEKLIEDKQVGKDDDICYIICTSGSTGVPKLVPNSYRSVKNLMLNLNHYILDDGRILHKTPLSFGVSLTEVFGFLLHLSPLVILNDGEEKDIELITQAIIDYDIFYINFVPSFIDNFSNVLYRKIKGIGKHLNLVIMCAGEKLSKQKVSVFYKTIGQLGIKLINLYGSSETAVYIAGSEINCKDDVVEGEPFTNTDILIVDDNNNPVPLETVGRIIVKGESIFTGYDNEIGENHKKFVNINNEKYFDTGDVGKINFDRKLVVNGRRDNQVQILGIRVELEEIENAALNLESISNVIAFATGDDENKKISVVFEGDSIEITKKEIDSFFINTLPLYMRPSTYYFIKSFPRLASGKIDRNLIVNNKNLIEITEKTSQLEERSLVEEKVINIFAFLLSRDKNSINSSSSFFASGGNSILIMRLLQLIEEEFGVEVTISEIFDGDTVKDVSKKIGERLKIDTKTSTLKTLNHAPKKAKYAMTDMQKRMFITQTIQEDTAYNVTMAYTIDGSLDCNKLVKILNNLVHRHSILGTVFELLDGEYIQIPGVIKEMDVEVKSLVGYNFSIEEVINNFVRPFNLSQGEVIRSAIYKLGKDRWLFIVDLHHIVTDQISNQILINEITQSYNNGLESVNENDEEQYQYIDFSENRINEKIDDYWYEYFSSLNLDNLANLDSGNDDKKVRRIKQTIELSPKLREILSSKNVTLFSYFASCYACCLRQIENNSQVIFGTPINQRRFLELDNTLGMFSDSIPFGVKVSKSETFGDVLQNVSDLSKTFLDKSTKGIFELLNKKLQNHKIKNLNPYIYFFVFNDMVLDDLNLNGTIAKALQVDNDISKFDINLIVNSIDNKFEIELDYNVNRYNEYFIECFFKMFISTLNEAENFVMDLNEFQSFINFREYIKQKYLHQGKKIEIGYPNVIKRFSDTVRNYPQKIAVRHNDVELTYSELDNLSSNIANLLLQKYDVFDKNVVIHLSRSVNQILAIVSVLKAGGCYIPINEEFPTARIQQVLEEVDPILMITGKDLLGDFNVKGSKISFEEIFSRIDKKQFKEKQISENSLAYVMYTSGTTGSPKGVKVTHRNLLNLNSYFINELGVKPSDTVLQYANIGFDGSVWEIFMALLNGATLQLIDKDDRLIPEKVDNIIKVNNVTIAAIPSHVVSMYDLSPLRILINGGTVINQKSLRKYIGTKRIVNSYGPTECTVAATHFELQTYIENKQVPIGIPNSNINIAIKNGNKYCEEGEEGEILISGESISQGYWNNDNLTHEKFIFDEILQNIFYKTGDIGNWDSSGNLIFRGREDEQIKLHGHRIELGEIQNYLLSQKEVRDVVVVFDYKKQELVAFIQSNSIRGEILKARMSETFPMYMIPHKFINIESFPLTSNGKPDKKALINISNIAKSNLKAEEEEAILCTVCYKILKQELGDSLNLECSFVDNGGDSLRAMKVTSELKKNNYSASVRDLLKTKSLKDFITNTNLQDYVHNENKQSNIYTTLGTPIMQDFLKKDLPNSSHFCQAIVVDISKTSLATLLNGINYLIDRHDSLRLSITEEHNFKINLPGYRKYYFENQILKEQISQQIVDVISEKIISKINLEDNNLIAVEYVETPDTNYAFICIHHLLVDVVSWGIILQDLDDYICNQECDTSRCRLLKAIESINKLPVDEEEFNYWNQVTLAHKSNNFENYEFSQEIQKNYLKLEFSQDNLKVIQSNLKVEHFLLSLIVRCFAMISQKNNIQVMLEGHGRMFKDYLENVIDVVGWFTSEYPINFDVKRDLVAQCDEIERRMLAVPNNGLMYSKVKKSLSQVACPDILFNYLGDSFADTSWKVLKRTNYSINNMISDNNYQKSIFMVLLEKTDNAFEISITSDSQHYSLEFMEEFCKLVKQEFENFLS